MPNSVHYNTVKHGSQHLKRDTKMLSLNRQRRTTGTRSSIGLPVATRGATSRPLSRVSSSRHLTYPERVLLCSAALVSIGVRASLASGHGCLLTLLFLPYCQGETRRIRGGGKTHQRRQDALEGEARRIRGGKAHQRRQDALEGEV